MKKLLFMFAGVMVLSLILPAQADSQTCCVTEPVCKVVSCNSAAPAEKSASVEVKEVKEIPGQAAQLAFASFLHPVLNASSALFANQLALLFQKLASCDPSDCDPSCCFPPVCDPSSCDLSKCTAKKE
jgi:hypothetical protein